MKHAWLEAQTIRDIAHSNPNEIFHPDVAKLYDTEVPDDAENGDTWDGVTLTKLVIATPLPNAPVEPIPPTVSPVQFKLLFTSAERIAMKVERTVDPVIDDFFDIVEDPRLTGVDLSLQSTQDALMYLESKGHITSARRLEIILGVLK